MENDKKYDDRKYICGTCNAEYDSQEALDKHIRERHKPVSPPPAPDRREAPTPNR